VAERRFHTRGQPLAVQAASAMLASHVPHALLLVGPSGVGKTTMALDLAAALLCRAPDPAARPCRECRACRAVEHGNHPDLHRLAPLGPGAVIPIGRRDEPGVRELVAALALLPVEGGARVGIVEAAHRLTEDAQAALLKTLEEPPAGTTIILCADDEDRLLPTLRSRCVRLRLGPLDRHDVEAVVIERGGADAAAAARAARYAGGRPGLALAYVAAPEALVVRGEIGRSLLDLRGGSRTARLAGFRDLASRAAELVRQLEGGRRRAGAAADGSPRGAVDGPASKDQREDASPTADPGSQPEPALGEADEAAGRRGARAPAAERRSAALALVGVWRDVLRDLAALGLGDPSLVRDIDLLDDLLAASPAMPPEVVAANLARLDVAGEQLEGNVSPELVLDVLALHHGR
jgi:DNA polymerase III delta' subunit